MSGSKPPESFPARRDAPTQRKTSVRKRSTLNVPAPPPVAPVPDEVFDPPLLEPAPAGLSRRGWLLLAAGLAIPALAGAGVMIANALRTRDKEKRRSPGLQDVRDKEHR